MRALSRATDIPLSGQRAILLRALVVVALALAVILPLAG
ncbi:ENTH domain-containing protein [Hyphomicrobiales bacterium]|nr:ENTH domain-containing protein [Hyphomicrobiales bacterium]